MPELRRRKRFRNPAHNPREIQDSEKNQHHAHGQFHGESHSSRNHDAEQNNCRAHKKNRDGVPHSPKSPDHSSMSNAPLPADNRRHRNDVVRISGMPHSKKEAKSDDGEQRDHLF